MGLSQDFIPLSVPNINGRELELITEAVETEWVSTAGPFVEQFEKDIARYVNAEHAVACQNGTSGIHLALLALGIGACDAVIVPAATFIAAVNPVSYVGAMPIFMDCDESLCIDPAKLERFCEEECSLRDGVLIHLKSGHPIKALIVVHVFGNMADMEAICSICARYNIQVIEDATEALGTYYTEGPYRGKFAGTMGRVGVYSFNGNKIITTGGGGMIVTDDQELAMRMRHLSTQAKSDPAYFEHDEIGYNYRMTNLQAAMGIAQLEQLESFIDVKHRNYRAYQELLEGVYDLGILGFRPGTRSNKWFYSLICDSEHSRDELIRHLGSKGIQARPLWGIICDQKPYQGSEEFEVQRARDYREKIVNVPCSTNLDLVGVSQVVDAVKECFADKVI